jgi:hypothetical protein
MRNENKRSAKQAGKKNISNERLKNKQRGTSSGSRLDDEHAVGNTAERKIGRTPHDKNSVTGSDFDGQAE